jgi:hypothetical protein
MLHIRAADQAWCDVILILLILNLKHKMASCVNDFVHEFLLFIIGRQSVRIKEWMDQTKKIIIMIDLFH